MKMASGHILNLLHASPLEKRNAPRGTQSRKSHSPQDIQRSRTGPVSARNQVAIHQQAKRNEATIKHLQALQVKIAALDREHDYVSRYVKVKHYLNSLSGDKKDVLEPEVMTYGLSTLIHIWKEKCSRNQRDQSMPVAALIWNVICEITKRNHGITEDIANCCKLCTKYDKKPQFPGSEHIIPRQTATFLSVCNNEFKQS